MALPQHADAPVAARAPVPKVKLNVSIERIHLPGSCRITVSNERRHEDDTGGDKLSLLVQMGRSSGEQGPEDITAAYLASVVTVCASCWSGSPSPSGWEDYMAQTRGSRE